MSNEHLFSISEKALEGLVVLAKEHPMFEIKLAQLFIDLTHYNPGKTIKPEKSPLFSKLIDGDQTDIKQKLLAANFEMFYRNNCMMSKPNRVDSFTLEKFPHSRYHFGISLMQKGFPLGRVIESEEEVNLNAKMSRRTIVPRTAVDIWPFGEVMNNRKNLYWVCISELLSPGTTFYNEEGNVIVPNMTTHTV